MSMLDWLRRMIGAAPSSGADRRRYERFDISAPLEVECNGVVQPCRLTNLSAGGVRIEPAFDAIVGAPISVRDPASGMRLDGVIFGHGENDTRVQFDSEEAGIVVSTWIRMAAEDAEAEDEAETDPQGTVADDTAATTDSPDGKPPA